MSIIELKSILLDEIIKALYYHNNPILDIDLKYSTRSSDFSINKKIHGSIEMGSKKDHRGKACIINNKYDIYCEFDLKGNIIYDNVKIC